MIVPLADGRRLYPDDRPSFADVLLAMPYDLDIERDPSPVRAIEF